MFINQKVSLEDILGKDYIGALCAANSALGMMDAEEAAKIASEKIDFYSEEVQKKNDELLSYVGKQIAPVFTSDTKGAGTNAYMRLPPTGCLPLPDLPTTDSAKTENCI